MEAIKYISYSYPISVQYYTVHRNIEIFSFVLEVKFSELISPYDKINLTIIVLIDEGDHPIASLCINQKIWIRIQMIRPTHPIIFAYLVFSVETNKDQFDIH